MELLDIQIFCDLVEVKSFTEAARKNCLTQSAVSQRINRLNEYYGNKLFLNKKRLVLSWHGKYLYEKFRDILKIYATTEEIIENKAAMDIVSIGLSENAKTKYFGSDLFQRIAENNVLPEIYIGPSQSIYEKVLFGSLDYGIMGSLPHEPGDLVVNKLYDEKIVLVTATGNPVETIVLSRVPLILDHRDSGLYLFLKNAFLSRGEDVEKFNIKGFVGTSSEKRAILAQTDFYAFLPEWYVSEQPGLDAVPLDIELTRDFYEIYRKERTGKVAFLRDLISELNKSPK